jgi:hypothetical protein
VILTGNKHGIDQSQTHPLHNSNYLYRASPQVSRFKAKSENMDIDNISGFENFQVIQCKIISTKNTKNHTT